MVKTKKNVDKLQAKRAVHGNVIITARINFVSPPK